MKKLLSLFLLSIVLILSACGSDEEKPEEAKKPEVEEVQEKEAIEVTINVEPIIDEDGKVHFEGETNLPDHGEVMFSVTGDNYNGSTKEVVLDGAYETEIFSKDGEAMSPGEYNLSVSLSIPSTQDEKFTEVAGKDYEYLTGDLMDDGDIGRTMGYETTFTIEQQEVEKVVKDDAIEEVTLSVEELEEIIEYNAVGEGDELTSVTLEGGEIKAVIEMAPQDLFPAEVMAATRYSQMSDELLAHEGWEVLTVDYVDVGTISMNRSEKESNEFGDYFPTEKIDEILGVEY